jgi:hypothetical protein
LPGLPAHFLSVETLLSVRGCPREFRGPRQVERQRSIAVEVEILIQFNEKSVSEGEIPIPGSQGRKVEDTTKAPIHVQYFVLSRRGKISHPRPRDFDEGPVTSLENV